MVGETWTKGAPRECGQPGRSGIEDCCIWLGKSTLENFRRFDQDVCLLVREPLSRNLTQKEDTLEVTEWKSRSEKRKWIAVSKNPTKKVSLASPHHLHDDSVPKKYMLELDRNVYTCRNATFFPCISCDDVAAKRGSWCYVFACVTFKTSGAYAKQVLITSRCCRSLNHVATGSDGGANEEKYF